MTEKQVLEALINLSKEQLILDGKNLEELKSLKKKLENELKKLMDEENQEDSISIIEKKLEEIDDQIRKMTSSDLDNRKHELEKMKSELELKV